MIEIQRIKENKSEVIEGLNKRGFTVKGNR